MDAVIIVFVMATGFVAVTVVLPILFWFTQTSPFQQTLSHPAAAANNPYFQTKPIPTTQSRPTSYASQATLQNHRGFEVKALPPYYSARRLPSRRIAVAS